jgi:DNA-binding response OmpR family regulator
MAAPLSVLPFWKRNENNFNHMTSKKAKKILLVEDDKSTSKVIKLILEQSGHEISIVADGEKALAAIDDQIDLVMLDLVLPKKSGFEVLQAIRQEKKLAMPIIVFSNLSRNKDIERAIDLGADDYLVKSEFSVTRLKQKIRIFLKEN